ncbi:MAG: YihY/virulence factor BrkB family protein [Longimicrobiales bacterium]
MQRIAETLRQAARGAREDGITGEAAKVAFYFFLSFFPIILALLAFTGLFGGDAAFVWIMDQIAAAVPPETEDFLARFVAEIAYESRPDVLSVGLVLTLWTASNVFAALADGLNTMYDIDETRPWLRKRGLALLIFAAAVILLLGGATAIVAGPEIASALRLAPVWTVMRWPAIFGGLVALHWLVYYFLPNRDQDGVKFDVFLGALAGSTVLILGTALFRIYVANFGSYSDTYGFVGAIIVLLLWLYLAALAILFGGEVAAVLEGLRTEAADRHGAAEAGSYRPPPADAGRRGTRQGA